VTAPSTPVETRAVVAAGLTVRARVQGEGEPVLLLSGLGQPLEAWDPFIASLGPRRVVRVDSPGAGQSPTPLAPPSMASLASIAAAVLDAFDVEAADVVGFSLGGAVAQQLAHARPARVRRLVLVATSCGLGSTPGRWDWRDALDSPSRPTRSADLLSALWPAAALATWSSIPFLARLAQPTLVVCGRDDSVSPPGNARVLASRIPGARLVTLNADHGVLRPGPAAELARVVEGFLGAVDADRDVAPAEPSRDATPFAVSFVKGSTVPELRLDGRVAVITGAGGGLGRSHALELASRGAYVVVNDLGGALDGQGSSASAAQLVADEIVALGGVAVANHDSVATPEGGEAIIETAIDAFGRVDVLVNNAGILRDRAFHKMDADVINQVIDVHLKGAFFVTQPAFRRMREQRYGRIVSTSSASGLFGNFGQANYGAAKAGLAGLTRVLAIEGAQHGVRANAIAPIALTRMTEGILGDLSPMVSPRSVSPLVAYLASEECSVTGHVYSVAGGRIARIFVGETEGTVLSENTAEAVRAHLEAIDNVDPADFFEPASLDAETAIIAEALANAS
jgi:NAD(P)-dependent dehydrogenase (short-subunit alcohol dehydrogenase family)/pimeloyl-ACP methyl ester carboxylesterase